MHILLSLLKSLVQTIPKGKNLELGTDHHAIALVIGSSKETEKVGSSVCDSERAFVILDFVTPKVGTSNQ